MVVLNVIISGKEIHDSVIIFLKNSMILCKISKLPVEELPSELPSQSRASLSLATIPAIATIVLLLKVKSLFE